jgi:hypothetical protein
MGAMLRCKMKVESVVETKDGDGKKNQEQVTLRAVYGPEGSENRQWARYTPSGELRLSIDNQNAFGKLVKDREYYIDFTPAEELPIAKEPPAAEAGATAADATAPSQA